MIDRREFLKSSALAAASGLLVHEYAASQSGPTAQAMILPLAPESVKTRLAAQELRSGLRTVFGEGAARFVTDRDLAGTATLLTLTIDAARFKGVEEYVITRTAKGVELCAAGEQALLYAVFDFLERQGMVFGIDGATAPINRTAALRLPEQGQPWTAQPRFATRGLLPWPDFLNCISIYNDEDFKAYFAAMLRMRLNTFGMHVYTENTPGPLAESYLSFDFAGSGHRAALEDSTTDAWGYLPQRTSTFKMGGDRFFDTVLLAGLGVVSAQNRTPLTNQPTFSPAGGIFAH